MPQHRHPDCILIVGNRGFTGRHLVEHLKLTAPNTRICGFDLDHSDPPLLDEQFIGDLRQLRSLDTVLQACRPHTVYHLAGRMTPATDAEIWELNVGGTMNLLEAVRHTTDPVRVVAIGSAAEYGPTPPKPVCEDHQCRPTSVYGRSKLAQTMLCQHYFDRFGVETMVVRPFNLLGPGMPRNTVIGEACGQLVEPTICESVEGAHAPPTVRLGDLGAVRDFVDVRDAVAMYSIVAQRGTPGQIYNIGTGRPTRVRDLVEQLIRLIGQHHVLETRNQRAHAADVDYSCADVSKLQAIAPQLRFRSTQTTLRDVLASLRPDNITASSETA